MWDSLPNPNRGSFFLHHSVAAGLLLSLLLHAGLFLLLFVVLPLFSLHRPVSLQEGTQSLVSTKLVASVPKAGKVAGAKIAKTKPTLQTDNLESPKAPKKSAKESDSDKSTKRGGNTKLKTNSAEAEGALQGAKRINKTREKTEKPSKSSHEEPLSPGEEAALASKYSSLLRHMNEVLVQNWTRPESVQQGEALTVAIELTLQPGGTIEKVAIKKPSGNDLFDRSALAAVQKIPKFAVPNDKVVFEKFFHHLTIYFENPVE